MTISVDQTKATAELSNSIARVQANPSVTCPIKPAIDFILAGKNCLTYRYILLTALTAKATEENVDIMSLQASDSAEGSYDARSFCKHVIFPFQREFLYDILNGSNEDPLVNNPGRNPRISALNKSANGDPKEALSFLCEYLPLVETSEKARECLDYFLTCCLEMAERKSEQATSFQAAILTTDVFATRRFMSELLDKSFGGSALLLVASAIFSVLYPGSKGYEVIPHPVNQAGTSSRQMSDLDVFRKDGAPVLAVELKDKPFTETEVRKAARIAHDHGAPSMLFIAGRASALTDDIYRYFNDAKAEYESKGMIVGVMTIDALLDFFFATNYEADSATVFDLMRSTMESTRASAETMRWVYKEARKL